MISDGEIKDQALLPAAQLGKLMDGLAKLDSDPNKAQQGYDKAMGMLFGSLYNGNPAAAANHQWIIRFRLAAELNDDTLL